MHYRSLILANEIYPPIKSGSISVISSTFRVTSRSKRITNQDRHISTYLLVLFTLSLSGVTFRSFSGSGSWYEAGDGIFRASSSEATFGPGGSE